MLVLVALALVLVLVVAVLFVRQRRAPVSLVGQTVLITGVAADNMGEALARQSRVRGAARVFMLHSKEAAPGIADVVARVRRTPGGSSSGIVEAHMVDLTDVAATAELIGRVGDVHVAILSHVVCSVFAPATEISVDSLAFHMRVNFYSCAHLAQLLCGPNRPLRRVVLLSSQAALLPQPNRAAYCASKAAATSFFATMAIENPQANIQIVHPGMIDTPPVRAEYHESVMRAFGAMSPDSVAVEVLDSPTAFIQLIGKGGRLAYVLWTVVPSLVRVWLPQLLPKTKSSRFTK